MAWRFRKKLGAILKEVSKNQPIAVNQWHYVQQVYSEIIKKLARVLKEDTISSGDRIKIIYIIRSLKEMKRIVIFSGPMERLHSTIICSCDTADGCIGEIISNVGRAKCKNGVREILHLDTTINESLLGLENRSKLIQALIHEAGARLSWSDEDNKIFTQECIQRMTLALSNRQINEINAAIELSNFVYRYYEKSGIVFPEGVRLSSWPDYERSNPKIIGFRPIKQLRQNLDSFAVGKLPDDLERFEKVAWLDDKNPKTDTQVLVCRNTENNLFNPKLLYIIFRGTEFSNINEWLLDLDYKQVSIPWLEDCSIKVHHGFLSAYLAVAEQLIAICARENPDRIIITGHSLGGALAELCTVHLSWLLNERKIFNVKAFKPTIVGYAFGHPRVGNQFWKILLDEELKCDFYRIDNGADIVPDVPFKMIMLFELFKVWEYITNRARVEQLEFFDTGREIVLDGIPKYSLTFFHKIVEFMKNKTLPHWQSQYSVNVVGKLEESRWRKQRSGRRWHHYPIIVPEFIQKKFIGRFNKMQLSRLFKAEDFDDVETIQGVDVRNTTISRYTLEQLADAFRRTAPPEDRKLFEKIPSLLNDIRFVITTDQNILDNQGRIHVAACNIENKIAYLHPYFFVLAPIIQEDILRHEIFGHILHDTEDEGVACRVSYDYFKVNFAELKQFISAVNKSKLLLLAKDSFCVTPSSADISKSLMRWVRGLISNIPIIYTGNFEFDFLVYNLYQLDEVSIGKNIAGKSALIDNISDIRMQKVIKEIIFGIGDYGITQAIMEEYGKKVASKSDIFGCGCSRHLNDAVQLIKHDFPKIEVGGDLPENVCINVIPRQSARDDVPEAIKEIIRLMPEMLGEYFCGILVVTANNQPMGMRACSFQNMVDDLEQVIIFIQAAIKYYSKETWFTFAWLSHNDSLVLGIAPVDQNLTTLFDTNSLSGHGNYFCASKSCYIDIQNGQGKVDPKILAQVKQRIGRGKLIQDTREGYKDVFYLENGSIESCIWRGSENEVVVCCVLEDFNFNGYAKEYAIVLPAIFLNYQIFAQQYINFERENITNQGLEDINRAQELVGKIIEIGPLLGYLSEHNKGHEAEIDKTINMWFQYPKRLLEFACYNGEIAYELAYMNKDMATFATDIFNTSYKDTKTAEYIDNANAWENGDLDVQRQPRDNFNIFRATIEMLNCIPDNSLDYILLSNPEDDLACEFLINLKLIYKKLKNNGKFIFKPVRLGLCRNGFAYYVEHSPKTLFYQGLSDILKLQFKRILEKLQALVNNIVSENSDSGFTMRVSQCLKFLDVDLANAFYSDKDREFILENTDKPVVSIFTKSCDLLTGDQSLDCENMKKRCKFICAAINGATEFDIGDLPEGQVKIVCEFFRENRIQAYIIGGAMLSLLIGGESSDVDIAVDCDNVQPLESILECQSQSILGLCKRLTDLKLEQIEKQRFKLVRNNKDVFLDIVYPIDENGIGYVGNSKIHRPVISYYNFGIKCLGNKVTLFYSPQALTDFQKKIIRLEFNGTLQPEKSIKGTIRLPDIIRVIGEKNRRGQEYVLADETADLIFNFIQNNDSPAAQDVKNILVMLHRGNKIFNFYGGKERLNVCQWLFSKLYRFISIYFPTVRSLQKTIYESTLCMTRVAFIRAFSKAIDPFALAADLAEANLTSIIKALYDKTPNELASMECSRRKQFISDSSSDYFCASKHCYIEEKNGQGKVDPEILSQVKQKVDQGKLIQDIRPGYENVFYLENGFIEPYVWRGSDEELVVCCVLDGRIILPAVFCNYPKCAEEYIEFERENIDNDTGLEDITRAQELTERILRLGKTNIAPVEKNINKAKTRVNINIFFSVFLKKLKQFFFNNKKNRKDHVKNANPVSLMAMIDSDDLEELSANAAYVFFGEKDITVKTVLRWIVVIIVAGYLFYNLMFYFFSNTYFVLGLTGRILASLGIAITLAGVSRKLLGFFSYVNSPLKNLINLFFGSMEDEQYNTIYIIVFGIISVIGLPIILINEWSIIGKCFSIAYSYILQFQYIYVFIACTVINIAFRVYNIMNDNESIDELNIGKRILASLFCAPVGEEILFRFIIFGLSRWFFMSILCFIQPLNYILPFIGVSIGWDLPLGIFLAIAMNADMFFKFHGENKCFIQWFMGVLFTYIYFTTGSLLIPIIIHFLNNIVAFILDFLLDIFSLMCCASSRARPKIYCKMIPQRKSKDFNRCTYPLPVPQDFQEQVDKQYLRQRILSNVIVNNLNLSQPESFIENHYKMMSDRLKSLKTNFSQAPPELKWRLVITADSALTNGQVAAANINQRISTLYSPNTVFIHIYFFTLASIIQEDILRHEILGHILQNTENEGVAYQVSYRYFKNNFENLILFLKEIKKLKNKEIVIASEYLNELLAIALSRNCLVVAIAQALYGDSYDCHRYVAKQFIDGGIALTDITFDNEAVEIPLKKALLVLIKEFKDKIKYIYIDRTYFIEELAREIEEGKLSDMTGWLKDDILINFSRPGEKQFNSNHYVRIFRLGKDSRRCHAEVLIAFPGIFPVTIPVLVEIDRKAYFDKFFNVLAELSDVYLVGDKSDNIDNFCDYLDKTYELPSIVSYCRDHQVRFDNSNLTKVNSFLESIKPILARYNNFEGKYPDKINNIAIVKSPERNFSAVIFNTNTTAWATSWYISDLKISNNGIVLFVTDDFYAKYLKEVNKDWENIIIHALFMFFSNYDVDSAVTKTLNYLLTNMFSGNYCYRGIEDNIGEASNVLLNLLSLDNFYKEAMLRLLYQCNADKLFIDENIKYWLFDFLGRGDSSLYSLVLPNPNGITNTLVIRPLKFLTYALNWLNNYREGYFIEQPLNFNHGQEYNMLILCEALCADLTVINDDSLRANYFKNFTDYIIEKLGKDKKNKEKIFCYLKKMLANVDSNAQKNKILYLLTMLSVGCNLGSNLLIYMISEKILSLDENICLNLNKGKKVWHFLYGSCDEKLIAEYIDIAIELFKLGDTAINDFNQILAIANKDEIRIAMHKFTGNELQGLEALYYKEKSESGEKNFPPFWQNNTIQLPRRHPRIVESRSGYLEGHPVKFSANLGLQEVSNLLRGFLYTRCPDRLASLIDEANTKCSIFSQIPFEVLESLINLFFVERIDYFYRESNQVNLDTTFFSISDLLLKYFRKNFQLGYDLPERIESLPSFDPLYLLDDDIFRSRISAKSYRNINEVLTESGIKINGCLRLGGRSIYGELPDGWQLVIKLIDIRIANKLGKNFTDEMNELAREFCLVWYMQQNKEFFERNIPGIILCKPVEVEKNFCYGLFRLERIGSVLVSDGQPPIIKPEDFSSGYAIMLVKPPHIFRYGDDPNQVPNPEVALLKANNIRVFWATRGVFFEDWDGFDHGPSPDEAPDRAVVIHRQAAWHTYEVFFRDGAGQLYAWPRRCWFTNYRYEDIADLGHAQIRKEMIEDVDFYKIRENLAKIIFSPLIVYGANRFNFHNYPHKFYYETERLDYRDFIRNICHSFYKSFVGVDDCDFIDELYDWDEIAYRLMYEMGYVIRQEDGMNNDLGWGHGPFPDQEGIIKLIDSLVTLAIMEKSVRCRVKNNSSSPIDNVTIFNYNAAIKSIEKYENFASIKILVNYTKEELFTEIIEGKLSKSQLSCFRKRLKAALGCKNQVKMQNKIMVITKDTELISIDNTGECRVISQYNTAGITYFYPIFIESEQKLAELLNVSCQEAAMFLITAMRDELIHMEGLGQEDADVDTLAWLAQNEEYLMANIAVIERINANNVYAIGDWLKKLKYIALESMAAKELLDVLDLTDIVRNSKITILEQENLFNGTLIRYKISIPQRQDKKSIPQGLNVLQNEFNDLCVFEILADEVGLPLVIYPVYPLDWHNDKRMFDITPYYFMIPQSNDLLMREKFHKHNILCKKYEDFILQYNPDIRMHYKEWGDTRFHDSTPYCCAQIIQDRKKHITQLLMLDRYLKDNILPPESEMLVTPRFFTLYNPAVYWNADTDYYDAISRIKLQKDWNICVVGPGSGIDFLVIAWRLKKLFGEIKKPIYVIGKNPIEIAAVKYLAKIHNIPVVVRVGDNIIDENGVLQFSEAEFDLIIWNKHRSINVERYKDRSAIEGCCPEAIKRKLMLFTKINAGEEFPLLANLQDIDIDAMALKRFIKGIGIIQKGKTIVIFWDEGFSEFSNVCISEFTSLLKYEPIGRCTYLIVPASFTFSQISDLFYDKPCKVRLPNVPGPNWKENVECVNGHYGLHTIEQINQIIDMNVSENKFETIDLRLINEQETANAYLKEKGYSRLLKISKFILLNGIFSLSDNNLGDDFGGWIREEYNEQVFYFTPSLKKAIESGKTSWLLEFIHEGVELNDCPHDKAIELVNDYLLRKCAKVNQNIFTMLTINDFGDDANSTREEKLLAEQIIITRLRQEGYAIEGILPKDRQLYNALSSKPYILNLVSKGVSRGYIKLLLTGGRIEQCLFEAAEYAIFCSFCKNIPIHIYMPIKAIYQKESECFCNAKAQYVALLNKILSVNWIVMNNGQCLACNRPYLEKDYAIAISFYDTLDDFFSRRFQDGVILKTDNCQILRNAIKCVSRNGNLDRIRSLLLTNLHHTHNGKQSLAFTRILEITSLKVLTKYFCGIETIIRLAEVINDSFSFLLFEERPFDISDLSYFMCQAENRHYIKDFIEMCSIVAMLGCISRSTHSPNTAIRILSEFIFIKNTITNIPNYEILIGLLRRIENILNDSNVYGSDAIELIKNTIINSPVEKNIALNNSYFCASEHCYINIKNGQGEVDPIVLEQVKQKVDQGKLIQDARPGYENVFYLENGSCEPYIWRGSENEVVVCCVLDGRIIFPAVFRDYPEFAEEYIKFERENIKRGDGREDIARAIELVSNNFKVLQSVLAWEKHQLGQSSISNEGEINNLKFIIDGIASANIESSREIKFIDLGCGSSSYALDVKNILLSEYGINTEAYSLEFNASIPRGVEEGKVSHFRGSIENMSFPDMFFDVVFSITALCYTNLDKTGRELQRVLRMGGRAIIIDMHPESSWIYDMNKNAEYLEFLLRNGGEVSINDRITINALQDFAKCDYDRQRLFVDRQAIRSYFEKYGFVIRDVTVLQNGYRKLWAIVIDKESDS